VGISVSSYIIGEKARNIPSKQLTNSGFIKKSVSIYK
jgi:hypothetical protein